MIGIVQSVDKSKSGKSWRVKIDGKFYGAKFDSHLETAVGKAIDFFAKPTDFGDWIESWAFSQSAPAAAAQVASKATDGRVGNGDRWWLPFCSNQTNALIAAGVIKDRATLNQWMKDLKEAVIALDAL